ncbi:MAG: serine hydroxymethyltransferase [Deltaproteobacteria bacterium]|nr:serine hydroxymethyltransferase [Deltaproteobacteria bacterium]MBW1914250.1 serine hydroxymethyltransferase [Deltaproteobacteria bacterium]
MDLKNFDSEIADAIQQEADRERDSLVMIASENYTSQAVIEAQANVMTNKYAEGYPAKRYYGGCEYVDIVERLAIQRAKELFHAEYVNVQPHAGSQANMAVYFSCLKPGDTILGMDLNHGGHLTHGSRVSFSGNLYNAISYGLTADTQRIDFDHVRSLAREHKPRMIIVGASAYPRILDFPRFREIADEVGAYLMADMAHIAGLVAANLHPTPLGYADFVTTTTHKTLRGPRGGLILSNNMELGASLNKSIFPGIQGGPFMHVIAAKAVCFKEALQPEFKEYQKQVIKNSKVLAQEMLSYDFDLISGGTDTHLILIDLASKNITGLEAEIALGKAGIFVNKNTVPFEKRSPQVTSGLRIGTPVLTTRGMKEQEIKVVAGLIRNILENMDNEKVVKNSQATVAELCKAFPVYDFL